MSLKFFQFPRKGITLISRLHKYPFPILFSKSSIFWYHHDSTCSLIGMSSHKHKQVQLQDHQTIPQTPIGILLNQEVHPH